MDIYSKIIKERFDNDSALVEKADQSLYHNKSLFIEEKDDYFQVALDYILNKYGLSSPWIHAVNNYEEIMETKLNPFGIMYEKIDTTDLNNIKKYSRYMIAFDEDEEVYVLYPGLINYRFLRISDNKIGFLDKNIKLKNIAYGIVRPLKDGKYSLKNYILLVLDLLSIKDILPVGVAMLMVTLLGAVAPRINKYVLSTVIDTKNLNILFSMMFLFLSAGILKTIFSSIKIILLNQLKTRISLQAQSTIVCHILLLPQRVLKVLSAGKLSKQINQSRRLASLIVGALIDTSFTALFSIVYIWQMGSYSVVLLIPAIIMLIVKIIVSFLIARSNMENEKNDMESSMENSRFMYMSIQAIQKIKGLGAEKRIYANWAKIYRKMLIHRLDQPALVKMKDVIQSFITALTTIIILAFAAPNAVSGADYIAFNTAYSLVLTAVDEILKVINSLFVMHTLSQNVETLFESEIEGLIDDELVRNLTGAIKVENVSFKYPGSNVLCLDDISFSIKKGEKIAIVGESGCGKSTLLNLLLGIEKPDHGMILYDNKPINSLNVRSLRRHIGTVLQFSPLMPGTIFSNIAFNKADLSEEEAYIACEKAQIADYIKTLPLGLYTEVSETQSNGFSGGQRQRIQLARVFAAKTNIKIFDEATSALDNVTQKNVLDAVYKESSTVIMVAHRLSTVKNCDRILLLEKGKICESGTYDELIKKNGRFANLVKKQLKDN